MCFTKGEACCRFSDDHTHGRRYSTKFSCQILTIASTDVTLAAAILFGVYEVLNSDGEYLW
jgi:hypothetical protein